MAEQDDKNMKQNNQDATDEAPKPADEGGVESAEAENSTSRASDDARALAETAPAEKAPAPSGEASPADRADEASEGDDASEADDAPAGKPESTARDAHEAPAGPLRGLAAYYEHPDHLLAAARYARESKYDDYEAYSPFPIHGMDDAMGLGRSWLPWVTFGAGLVGFLAANALQFGTMTFDWKMVIGGKPFAPWPSFVPVMFELTVLFAGVTTALVMLKVAGCFKKAEIIDERITNDRFVLWISAEDKNFDEDEVESFLAGLNPLEIKRVHQ